MYSLTETTRRLHIGKRRLYQLLESEGITPTLKSGHKLLTEADFQHISKTLQHGSEPVYKSDQAWPDIAYDTAQHRASTAHHTEQHVSDTAHNTPLLLLNRMSSEIEHLRQLLANEQEERRAERQERENYQQMVMVLQGDMKQLHQQLLETPTPSTFSMSNSTTEQAAPMDFAEAVPEADAPLEITEEVTPQHEAVVSNDSWSSRLTAFGLISTTIVVIAFFIAINNPDLILSKAITSLWQ
jgi:hypothetical protein